MASNSRKPRTEPIEAEAVKTEDVEPVTEAAVQAKPEGSVEIKKDTETKTVAPKAQTKKPIVAKDIDPSQYVTVRNGFQGQLIYKSPHTGERFVWDKFGDEQEMELRELKNAKSSSLKKFFINNWFLFDEDWIADYLGVSQYYKYALNADSFDDIFKKDADELKKVIGELSEGQKRSVAYRAKQLISEQKIDSFSVISTLEDTLGIELIEK